MRGRRVLPFHHLTVPYSAFLDRLVAPHRRVTPALPHSGYRNDTYLFDIVSLNSMGRRRIPVPAGPERNVSRITLVTAAGTGEQPRRGRIRVRCAAGRGR